MKYCTRCIMPATRPNIEMDAEGVCSACRPYQTRIEIDWAAREIAFRSVVKHAKSRSTGYDSVIPVSGGKDSTWQVVRCLEYGLNPLAVTWKTPARTVLGQLNLDNLVRLGVDHIDYQINPHTEREFLYRSFVKFGSTAIPMHMALFNIPITIATRFRIPLVVWGENSAFEYGGKAEEQTGFELNQRWLKKYGVTHATTAADWVGENLTAKQLTPYFGPSEEELRHHKLLAVFLGYYFPWDPAGTLRTALSNGFQVRPQGPKTGYYNYADIDDDFISIHHWLKWYKFGFTRLFDNLSLEIRHGRMSRAAAIEIVQQTGVQTPHADIARLCDFLRISEAHFYEIAETFRDRKIWSRRNGCWMIENFLISDWQWDENRSNRTAA
jgi:N-acetyl sugar amidotransferase